ncbi:MAG: transglutaminase-like domain-containing protein [Dehalobacterium sp.]
MNLNPQFITKDAKQNMGISFTLTRKENMDATKPAALQLLIVLLLNGLGTMLTLASAFRLPCHLGMVTGFVIISALLLGGGFLISPKQGWAVLSVGAVFCLFCIYFRSPLYEGFYQTLSWISEVIAEGSGKSPPWTFPTVPAYEKIPMTLFFAALLFPVLLLLSYAVIRRVNIFLLLLIIVPVLEMTLFFGCLPAVPAFVLLILGSFSLLVLHQSALRPGKGCLDARSSSSVRKQAGNLSLIIAVSAGVLMAVVWLLVSKTDYAAFTQNFALRSQAGETLKKALSFTYEERTPPQGGITGGEFSATGRFSFNGETALTVEADPLRGSIYLKGYVGGDYTGKGWQPLPRELARKGEELSGALKAGQLPSEVLNYDNAMLSLLFHAEQRLLKVTKTASAVARYQYLPYFLSAEALDELQLNEQGMITDEASRKDSYAVAYYDVLNYDNNLFLLNRQEIKNQLFGHLGLSGGQVSSEQLEEYFRREEEYADFVHEAYTRLSDRLSARLTEEFSPLANDFINIESLIKTVMGNLSGRAAYTLTPEETPEEKDYVDYFLYENRKGYCTHFASAATVIFRLCGIPARYVEGYVVTIEDYARAARTEEGRYLMEIKDTNAHAWCEIYLDGFGWLPVEVTPGLVAVNTRDTAPADGESIEYETEGESELNEIPMDMPQWENDPAAETAADGPGDERAKAGSGTGSPLWMVTAAVLLLLFIWGLLFLLLRKRAVKGRIRELRKENRSQSGLAWYGYLMDGLKAVTPEHLESREISALAWAGEMEKKALLPAGTLLSAMPVLQKAAYAQNEISPQEYESLRKILEQAVNHLYLGLPVLGKLKWQYMHRLPGLGEIHGKGAKH